MWTNELTAKNCNESGVAFAFLVSSITCMSAACVNNTGKQHNRHVMQYQILYFDFTDKERVKFKIWKMRDFSD